MLVQSVSFHLQLDLESDPALPTSIVLLRVVVLCVCYLLMLLQTTSMLCDLASLPRVLGARCSVLCLDPDTVWSPASHRVPPVLSSSACTSVGLFCYGFVERPSVKGLRAARTSWIPARFIFSAYAVLLVSRYGNAGTLVHSVDAAPSSCSHQATIAI